MDNVECVKKPLYENIINFCGIPAQKINYTKEDYNKCNIFALEQFQKNKDSQIEYQKRNSTIPSSTRIKYTTNGKLAELCYSRFLNNIKHVNIEPDFNIYTKDYKSFDADLVVGINKYHVKSTHLSYDPSIRSFGFYKKDRVLYTNDLNDNLAPVVLDLNNNTAYCLASFSINRLKSLDLLKGPNTNYKNQVRENLKYVYINDLTVICNKARGD